MTSVRCKVIGDMVAGICDTDTCGGERCRTGRARLSNIAICQDQSPLDATRTYVLPNACNVSSASALTNGLLGSSAAAADKQLTAEPADIRD